MAELSEMLNKYEHLKKENQKLVEQVARLRLQKKQLYESIVSYQPLPKSDFGMIGNEIGVTIRWTADTFTDMLEEI